MCIYCVDVCVCIYMYTQMCLSIFHYKYIYIYIFVNTWTFFVFFFCFWNSYFDLFSSISVFLFSLYFLFTPKLDLKAVTCGEVHGWRGIDIMTTKFINIFWQFCKEQHKHNVLSLVCHINVTIYLPFKELKYTLQNGARSSLVHSRSPHAEQMCCSHEHTKWHVIKAEYNKKK